MIRGGNDWNGGFRKGGEKELSHSFEGVSFLWVILGDWHWF